MRKSSKLSLVLILFLFLAGCGTLCTSETVKPGQEVKLLKEGNARFVEMKLQHPNESIERRKDTALNGQKPFATVLACSDSRLPVEVIFDRGIGDIFVVRVAGNIAADNSVIGSLEYGAEHLKTPLLVILGHTACGAVKAAVENSVVEGSIRDIQKDIEPVAIKTKKEYPGLSGPELINAAAKANVLQVKRDILSRSHIIKELVESGKLEILTAMYNINSGKVEWVK